VPDDLTSTTGIVALIAGGLALLALALCLVLALRLRRIHEAQRMVLGEGSERDLVAHAQSIQRSFDELHAEVQTRFQQLADRLTHGEDRLDHSICHSAVVRYDAYGEMSGRQSSSVALLDDTGTGVVMSSILHREQARVYVKQVHEGESELELSPEEQEAIDRALSGEPATPAA
jgi:hypothetical protein